MYKLLLVLFLIVTTVAATGRLKRRRRSAVSSRRSKVSSRRSKVSSKRKFNFPFMLEKECEKDDTTVTHSGYKSSGWCLMGECAISTAYQRTPSSEFSFVDQHWNAASRKIWVVGGS